MTTFDTNTRADLYACSGRVAQTGKAAEARVWRLLDDLSTLFSRSPADPAEVLAKAERREAARRAADNLLLR
jgi:hypothetical protein